MRRRRTRGPIRPLAGSIRAIRPHRTARDILRRLVRRVGYRGYFLLTLATIDVFQGLSFVDPGSASAAQTNVYLTDTIPLGNPVLSNWIWASAWWIVAVSCFYNAFKYGGDHWGFLMAIFIKVAYISALIFATASGLPDGPRRIVVWGVIASSVWIISRMPEPPQTVAEVVQALDVAADLGEADADAERENGDA